MARKTRITIETDSFLMLQGHSSNRAFCSRCGALQETVALEQIGVVSNLDASEVENWMNSDALHTWQAPDGSQLICLESLLARVQKTIPDGSLIARLRNIQKERL